MPFSGPGAPSLWHDAAMSNHVYRLTEVVGSSPTSVDDAIRTAVRKASETVRNFV